jgi:hypothetical protein
MFSLCTSDPKQCSEFFLRNRILKASLLFYTSPVFVSTSDLLHDTGRTRWHSWLRYCTPIREVAGSIPDGVNGNFH